MDRIRVPLEILIIVLGLGFRLRLLLIRVNDQRGNAQAQILHRSRHQSGNNFSAIGLKVGAVAYAIGEIRIFTRIGVQEQVLCSGQADFVILGDA
ncbi:hypothetical protein D3C75_724900 [compost metagenome]